MSYFDEMEARIPKGRVRTRFAPSPTGYMHVGNFRTALYTYLIAKKNNGDFILRIEDTDQSRLVDDAVDIIYSTLREAGLNWDEGPDTGGPCGPYIQTERREIYGKYAERLIELGGAYRCFCHKDEGGADGGFEKEADPCRELPAEESERRAAAGEPFVVRQKIPRGGTTSFVDEIFGEISVENDTLDDNVLIKSDGLPTYNFANVIDDHLMGITHVVRGSEYLSSAPKYNLLYEAFGWEIPKYIHCSNIMRDAQHKLSKRNGDAGYGELLEQGYIKEAVLNYIALCGWAPGGEREIFSLSELCEVFDIGGMSKSPAVFDIEKLRWMNSEYIRAMEPDKFFELAEPYLRGAVKNPEIDLGAVAALVQSRCEVLTDLPERVDFLDSLPEYGAELYCHKKMKTNEENSLETLKAALPVLEALEDWSEEGVHAALFGLVEQLGVKNGVVLWPVRVAVSGKQSTPGGAVEICALLGKDESLRRIRKGIDLLTLG